MFDKLQNIEDRYNQLTEKLMDPEVINDSNKLRDYSKEQSDIQPIVEKFRQYKEIRQQIDEAKTMLEEESDEDVMEMAQEELNELRATDRTTRTRNEITARSERPER